MAGAIVHTMDGRYGLAGWRLVELHEYRRVGLLLIYPCRWLFVINAIITVVWGLAGYVMIPDSPHKPNPWAFWFKRVHSEQAIERLSRENRLDIMPITWAAAKYAVSFLSSQTYC